MTPTERARNLLLAGHLKHDAKVHEAPVAQAITEAITEAEKEGFNRGWKQAGEMDGMATHEGTEPDKPELITEAVEAEREECARIAENSGGGEWVGQEIATDIRARGNQ